MKLKRLRLVGYLKRGPKMACNKVETVRIFLCGQNTRVKVMSNENFPFCKKQIFPCYITPYQEIVPRHIFTNSAP